MAEEDCGSAARRFECTAFLSQLKDWLFRLVKVERNLRQTPESFRAETAFNLLGGSRQGVNLNFTSVVTKARSPSPCIGFSMDIRYEDIRVWLHRARKL